MKNKTNGVVNTTTSKNKRKVLLGALLPIAALAITAAVVAPTVIACKNKKEVTLDTTDCPTDLHVDKNLNLDTDSTIAVTLPKGKEIDYNNFEIKVGGKTLISGQDYEINIESNSKIVFVIKASAMKAKNVELHVKYKEDKVNNIKLSKDVVSVKVGNTGTIKATLEYANAGEIINWSVDKEGVIKLDKSTTESDENITFVGEKEGTVNLTASCNGKTATCKVTVTSDTMTKKEWIEAYKPFSDDFVKSTTQYTADNVTVSGTYYGAYDPLVSSVEYSKDTKGLKYASINLKIPNYGIFGAGVAGSGYNADVIDQKFLTPMESAYDAVYSADSTSAGIKYFEKGTSNLEMEYVFNEKGYLTRLFEKMDGKIYADLIISYTEPVVKKVTSITINGGKEASFKVGDTTKLSYEVLPTDATDKSVTWSSSDEEKVTVDSKTGEISAKAVTKEGEPVTITATANDGSKVEGTCLLTVTAADPITKEQWIAKLSATIDGEVAYNKDREYTKEQITFYENGSETPSEFTDIDFGIYQDDAGNDQRYCYPLSNNLNPYLSLLSKATVTELEESLETENATYSYTKDGGYSYSCPSVTSGYKSVSFNKYGYLTEYTFVDETYPAYNHSLKVVYDGEPTKPEYKREYLLEATNGAEYTPRTSPNKCYFREESDDIIQVNVSNFGEKAYKGKVKVFDPTGNVITESEELTVQVNEKIDIALKLDWSKIESESYQKWTIRFVESEAKKVAEITNVSINFDYGENNPTFKETLTPEKFTVTGKYEGEENESTLVFGTDYIVEDEVEGHDITEDIKSGQYVFENTTGTKLNIIATSSSEIKYEKEILACEDFIPSWPADIEFASTSINTTNDTVTLTATYATGMEISDVAIASGNKELKEVDGDFTHEIIVNEDGTYELVIEINRSALIDRSISVGITTGGQEAETTANVTVMLDDRLGNNFEVMGVPEKIYKSEHQTITPIVSYNGSGVYNGYIKITLYNGNTLSQIGDAVYSNLYVWQPDGSSIDYIDFEIDWTPISYDDNLILYISPAE